MDEKNYKEILDFVKNGKYPVSVQDKNKKRNFRRKCKPFIFDDGLYYKKTSSSKRLQVVKKGKTDDIIQSIHAADHGGHLGVSKTWEKISTRFYWKGSFEDVRTFIQNCDNCQRKVNLKKAKKPLRPIKVPPEAFKQVGMDIIGPLETSYQGNKFIVVITEYLTKWVEAEGIPDKSSETVLSVLTKFVKTHGCPSVLITDQGREFCNDLNEKFCKQFGIEHRIASAYHPQTGGHTERFNRTLCDMLVHSVDTSQKNWDIKLPYVLFAYRTSKHESTKQTPFYLVFGRHARLPIELDLAMQLDDNQDSELSLKERIDSFIKLSCNRKEASSNIKTAQLKQKKYYDSSLPKDDTAGFEVGDQVLLHNTRKLTRKGGKLGLKWKGPFKITKVTGKGTYFLEGMKTSVSGNRLNRYRQSKDDAATNNNTEKRATEGPKDDHSPINKETGTQANEKAFERPAKRNDKSDDCNLPPKKRRVSREDVSTQPTNSTESTNQEPQPFQFKPSNHEWQQQISSVFKSAVKNTYASGPDKYIRRDAKPTRTVNMRGDGNCLFRAFSYLVFGVQTHHKLIRQAIVDFMKENENLMKGITRDSVSRYLDTSMMASENTWGTEVEIFAFATLTRSVVYVYSQYGSKEQWRWLEYKPLGLIGGNLRGRAVYIQNTSDHFVPVLEVDGEEFSRKPYKRIRNHIPEKYHALISDDLLDAALVNCYADEALLLKLDKSVKTVYVKAFTNTPYNVEGLRGLSDEVDANIFNIVCDWGDVENKLN